MLIRPVFRDEYIVQDIEIAQEKRGSEQRREEQCRGATIAKKNPVAENAIEIPVADEKSAHEGGGRGHDKCQGRQEDEPEPVAEIWNEKHCGIHC